MKRIRRIYPGLAGLLVVTGLIYAGLPWMASGLVKNFLTRQGMKNVEISIGYPGWRSTMVHTLGFSTVAGEYRVSCQISDIEVTYHIIDLLRGTLAGMRVAATRIQVQHEVPTTGTVSDLKPPPVGILQPAATGSPGGDAPQPLAVWLSGQWLSQLPVQEIIFDRLTLDWHTSASATYTAELGGYLRESEAQIKGGISLPAPGQSPLGFSLLLRNTGQTTLTLSPGMTEAPMLEWRVNSLVADSGAITLDGMLQAKLSPWLRVLPSAGSGSSGMPALEGELSSQWQAVLPLEKPGTAASLVLHDMQGQGTDWELKGEARAQIQLGEPEINATVKLLQIGGRYKNMLMAGLNAEAALVLGQDIRSSKDIRIRIASLDVGLPIKNIRGRLALKPPATRGKTGGQIPVVQVKQAAAGVLGGRAYSEPFVLDMNRDKNRFAIRIEGISLEEIVRLEQQQGVEGTGTLDGVLPMTLSAAGLQMKNGKLSAREPGGTIRYVPTEKVKDMAKTNTSLELVVGVLSNLQYHKLDVTSDYLPAGDLILQVRLEGNNPDWKGGQKVNLNLKLEENIPALLRSLQMSGEITERVGRHYQNSGKGQAPK